MSYFLLLTGFSPVLANENPNDFITIDFENAEIGNVFVLHQDDETTIETEIEKKELIIPKINNNDGMTSNSAGNTGWSGGTIPYYRVTMMARASNPGASLKYKVVATNQEIIDVHSLTYSVWLYNIQSTSLTLTKSRAELQFSALVDKIHSFGGYILFEINNNGS